MANAKYNTYLQSLLDPSAASFNLSTDAIKASLLDSADYTFSAAHDEYSGGSRDVPLAAIVAESAALATKTFVNGVFDSADFSWSTVTGDQSEIIVLWDDTLANDRLILYIDTSITGMPVTPNGGNINVTVNASGWYSL